jgi:hypothetical protein
LKNNQKSDNLFKYLLFVAKNAGTKNIWSDADKDLKAWMRKQNKEFLQLMTCQTSDDKMMVLNHVDFPWRLPLEVKWNQRYEELVKYHSVHNNCNVPRNVPHLGDWVNSQRRFKKMYDAASRKSSLTIERIEKLNTLGFEVPTTPPPNSRRRANLSLPSLLAKLAECIVLTLRKWADPSLIITHIRDDPSR